MNEAHPTSMTTADRLYQDRVAISQSPGLANAGIALAVVEPERVGWDKIEEYIDLYGFVGFSSLNKTEILEALNSRYGSDLDLPLWDTFAGEASDISVICQALLARLQAAPWRAFSAETPDLTVIARTQDLNARVGVSPLPEWYMRGEGPPSLTSWIEDEAGEMVACANGSMRYHAQSRLAGVYYVGSVCVSPEMQGKGLGVLVTALSIRDGLEAFQYKKAIGLAKPDNMPSRAMLARCGLSLDPERATVILNKSGAFQTR